MQISGWLQCCWWWCVRLLVWLEPVIPPHQLCVCCAVVYRPGATTGYDIVAAQPSAQRQAANRASYTPYSPTATLSSSHYYYHILTLRNCSVCTVEYQGASDVKTEIVKSSMQNQSFSFNEKKWKLAMTMTMDRCACYNCHIYSASGSLYGRNNSGLAQFQGDIWSCDVTPAQVSGACGRYYSSKLYCQLPFISWQGYICK